MPKQKISEFNANPALNTDIDSINIAEGCAPSGINDAIRELMSQLKDWQAGTSNDPMVIGSSGSLTLNQGTANGVAYLNGSKVVTSGTALVFDGTNLGIGTSSPAAKLHVQATQASMNMRSTGTGNPYIDFYTSTSSLVGNIYGIDGGGIGIGTTGGTERMRLDSSGNLGLGVTPSAWGTFKALQIGGSYGALNFSGIGGQVITNGYYDGSAYRYQTTNPAGISDFNVSSIGGFAWRIAPSGTAGNAITFTQAMTLDASGNLGVGTTSPLSYSSKFIEISNATSAGLKLTAGTSGLSLGADLSYIASDKSLRITTYESTGFIRFNTQDTERARIDSSGNLLVGTTSSDFTNSVGVRASANGFLTSTQSASTNANSTLNCYSTGAGANRFYVGWGGTVYATSTTITGISDQRLKENIRDLDEGLATVMALKPRKFDWKEGKGKDIKNDRGWIAQEFETVFPDMIEQWQDPAPEGEEPYKAVNANLIPTLVKAIQELKAEFDAYKASHP